MASGGLKKGLLSLMLFFVIFLSYRPFYGELVDLSANETLTNPLIEMVASIFPIFWTMLGIISLGLTVYFVSGEL